MGLAARAAAPRRPCRRHPRAPADGRGGARPRRAQPRRVRLLDRELGPAARRGRGPHEPLRRHHRARVPRPAPPGRPRPLRRPPRPLPRQPARADGGHGGPHRREHPARPVGGVRLRRRATRSSAAVTGAGRGGDGARRHRRGRGARAPVRSRDARPRSGHPDVGRGAHLQLPPLAVGLRGAGVRADAVARLRRATSSPRRSRPTPSAAAASGCGEQSRLAHRGRHPAGRGHDLCRAGTAAGCWSRSGVGGRADRAARVLRHGARAQAARAGRVRGRRRGPRGGARRRCCVGRGPARRDARDRLLDVGRGRGAPAGRRPVRRDGVRRGLDRARVRVHGRGARPARRARPRQDLLLAVLLGVWASDVAAFTIGRLFGRRLLAAEISPAKTVEGFLAGLVAGTATRLLHALPRAARPAAVDAPRARVRRRDRARRADR